MLGVLEYPTGELPLVKVSMESPQDQVHDLVRQAQAGDREAFGQLYDLYVDDVYRSLRYRVRSRETAEDITSETFLKALKSINSFTWQGYQFKTWLLKIAHNLLADHYKSARYRLESAVGSTLEAEVFYTIVDPDTAETVEALEMDKIIRAEIRAALAKLKPDHQEVITLRFINQLSLEETAEVMDRRIGAIKELQRRAVRALARLLPKFLFDRPPEES